MNTMCAICDLATESDVEQKFIYPLLTNKTPIGLGLHPSDIQTKLSIRKLTPSKGSGGLLYPDYLISIRGIVLAVIEAKSPSTNLQKGFSEAQHYASIVNARYRHGINPCNIILVSNGLETWFGYHDHDTPIIKLGFDDFAVENTDFYALQEHFSREKLLKSANSYYSTARGNAKFTAPVSELGGYRIQNTELPENSFGSNLIFEYRNIFEPQCEEDRILIVKNAYIHSNKREQHADPIHREIKKLKLPSILKSTLISTEKPDEIVSILQNHTHTKSINHSLILLIGAAGSGKSTFVRYFKEVYLKTANSELNGQCLWLFIDMNNAPVTNHEIYAWIKSTLLSSITTLIPAVDLTSFEVINRVFANEIKAFANGIGQLLRNTPEKYNTELYMLLKNKLEDHDILLKRVLEYIKNDFHIIPIVVLDNCDKRSRDEQLLMFQVSQWIRVTYMTLVVLPMRDSTYDNYRTEPPLDTVIKDLVFRIDPPDLLKVLQKRLEFITRIQPQVDGAYYLPSGIKVELKSNQYTEYYRCILRAIRGDDWSKRIFYNLSNRDTRFGIQYFVDLCKSGHISTDEIFKIKTCESQNFSYSGITNALLRKNRKYFNEQHSNFANIFASQYKDNFPDPFVRLDILNWLKRHSQLEGPNRVLGYHKIEKLTSDVQIAGHDPHVIYRETVALIRKGLIFCEANLEDIQISDLVKIAPSGFLHLDMLTNISYLAACAEEFNFKNSKTVSEIAHIISADNYLDKTPSLLVAKCLVDYLCEYRKEYPDTSSLYTDDYEINFLLDLQAPVNALDTAIDRNQTARRILHTESKYPTNKDVTCKVLQIKDRGILCMIEEEVRGFLSVPVPKHNLTEEVYRMITTGSTLSCKVLEYDHNHDSLQLRYISHSNPADTRLDDVDGASGSG